jgi:acyl carrier protein
MSTFEQLRDTVATTFNLGPRAITETTRQKDVASWDSLGHVNLMVALEGVFQLTLEPEDFSRLTSVPAILEYLQEHGVAVIP